MKRLRALLHSAGIKQGMIVGMAMVVAGGLDYAVNVLAGRWLQPVQFGIFISVTAILQVLLLLSIAIRMVVAFHTAEVAAQPDSSRQVSAFIQRAWRWAWRWGVIAALLMALVSPLLARLLHLPNAWPLWAASCMLLMLFLRETAYGALQGTLEFTGLGVVQVAQALLRIAFAGALIWIGGRAAGAIFAQPLACFLSLGLALWWLRPHFRRGVPVFDGGANWHYSVHTVVGLAAFGVLTNLDALFVKRFFSPEIAGDYGPVVTLAKISLFLPWAIGIVMFPKVTRRQATGRDPRPILLAALAAALAPGLGLTALYFVFPRMLVTAVFTSAYADLGVVLGLASLAATLYAGLNIWLNYALSLGRPVFVYVLLALVAYQATGMLWIGRSNLVSMTLVVVSAGVIGNAAGFATTWSMAPNQKAASTEAALPVAVQPRGA